MGLSSSSNSNYFRSYHTRMCGEEGARLFRLRWYGPVDYDNPSDKDVFVERKTHHESWVDEDSLKERFQTKWRKIPSYLAGTWDPHNHFQKCVVCHCVIYLKTANVIFQKEGKMKPADAEKSSELALQMQQQILGDRVKPSVRTTYNRTAFQLPTSNHVRISLDTQMILRYVILTLTLSSALL